MARLNLNICLSDIPRDLIRRAGNGKSYINLDVRELRETDERGNDHCVKVFVPQDRRDDYPDPIYLGRGREFKNDNQQQQRQARPAEDLPADNANGLPF